MLVVLIINLVSTLMLTGLIWFVQVVHYPLFHAVGRDVFSVYERAHQKLTSYIVVPLILAELISSVLLPVLYRNLFPDFLLWSNLALAVLIFLITITVQAPLHRRLLKGYDERVVQRLVRTSGIRVLLWSIKTGFVTTIFIEGVG